VAASRAAGVRLRLVATPHRRQDFLGAHAAGSVVAGACVRAPRSPVARPPQWRAGVLVYAGVCWRMLTYVSACARLDRLWLALRNGVQVC